MIKTEDRNDSKRDIAKLFGKIRPENRRDEMIARNTSDVWTDGDGREPWDSPGRKTK